MANQYFFFGKRPVKYGDIVKVGNDVGKVIVATPYDAAILLDDNRIINRPFDDIEIIEESKRVKNVRKL